MFDHVEIKVVHLDDCRRFYQTVLAPLSIELKWADEEAAGFGRIGHDKVSFLIEQGEQSTPCHLAFAASAAATVDAFHQIGVTAGFRCNGRPGLRSHYAPNYYAAFLRDPDGNNIEALAYLDDKRQGPAVA
ncbi:MAG: VOC family protein [Aeromonas sp.]|uniref:VOC family protein n=1 Tax=Aeromonas sp. TaxID=647 RepID=UPI002FC604C8